tara:strand:- start:16026 stop:16223 length:198 start_codon:yes stop_codon:yes gene_type:complete
MNEPIIEDGEDLYNPSAVMTQDPVIAYANKNQKKQLRILNKDDSPDPKILLIIIAGLYIYLRFLR